ncbi:probable disease resistance protein At5g45440 [Hibiscus syriacus]|uniref:probable disease resistance protein At5g45440 n=1 Tax=Hibiscus syriacus TaxID=106335 RepID=UPI001921FC3B|nr:probable disease resistance protein At5g45440 [Hibiscus syriacus]
MFWITLSEVPGVQTTGVEDTEETVELVSDVDGVSSLLDVHNQKLKEEKCLIVFDDVGDAEGDNYYKKLKDCFKGIPNENGRAVIVTCRSEEAAKKLLGDENLHRLQPLNDPDSCWWIYNEAVRDKEVAEDETVSKEVKEELMKRCGGLPWVARMMGKIKAQQLSDDKNKANQNNNTA